jgi:hypothetical protein
LLFSLSVPRSGIGAVMTVATTVELLTLLTSSFLASFFRSLMP